MKDLMSMVCLNLTPRSEGALCYLAQTLFCLWGVTDGGCIQNSLMSLGRGVRKKRPHTRKIARPTRDFINERSLSLT